jgi:hypothetical protein
MNTLSFSLQLSNFNSFKDWFDSSFFVDNLSQVSISHHNQISIGIVELLEQEQLTVSNVTMLAHVGIDSMIKCRERITAASADTSGVGTMQQTHDMMGMVLELRWSSSSSKHWESSSSECPIAKPIAAAEATCSRAVIQFHLSPAEACANTIHPNILAFTLTKRTRVHVTTSK